MRTLVLIAFVVVQLSFTACAAPKIRLFDDATIPLQEFTLQGQGKDKILVISVNGVISDTPSKGLFRTKPSMVQEVVSQLQLAEKDPEVKAVLLKIDSPGGSTTASDVLYHELLRFKERTGRKIVAAMMGMATSGGYYVALPADRIVAHPTTVTGSIGVIFLGPKFDGLMDKIGVSVEVVKSGENKDMGSPFRPSTDREKEMFDTLIRQLADRFIDLVAKHRSLPDTTLTSIRSAQVYLSRDALKLGLIDKIGYLNDALSEAKTAAHLPQDCRVIVYRRTDVANDNVYNPSSMQHMTSPTLLDVSSLSPMTSLSTGFYYLWSPGATFE